jgi:hypothetical protein
MLKILCSDNAAFTSGFVIGFSSTFTSRDVLNDPLPSLFSGSIWGTVYGYGALLVHTMIPPPLSAAIPIIGGIYASNKMRIEMQSSFQPQVSKEQNFSKE